MANSSDDLNKALQEFLSYIAETDSPKASLNIRVDRELYKDFQRVCGKKSITRVVSGLMRFYIAVSGKMRS